MSAHIPNLVACSEGHIMKRFYTSFVDKNVYPQDGSLKSLSRVQFCSYSLYIELIFWASVRSSYMTYKSLNQF